MKNIPEQQTIYLLKQIKNKGVVRHTKDKYESLMIQIKPRISYEDFSRITRARFHATHGEGAFEFNDVLDELIVKYDPKRKELEYQTQIKKIKVIEDVREKHVQITYAIAHHPKFCTRQNLAGYNVYYGICHILGELVNSKYIKRYDRGLYLRCLQLNLFNNSDDMKSGYWFPTDETGKEKRDDFLRNFITFWSIDSYGDLIHQYEEHKNQLDMVDNWLNSQSRN